jgi:hypothetical protein
LVVPGIQGLSVSTTTGKRGSRRDHHRERQGASMIDAANPARIRISGCPYWVGLVCSIFPGGGGLFPAGVEQDNAGDAVIGVFRGTTSFPRAPESDLDASDPLTGAGLKGSRLRLFFESPRQPRPQERAPQHEGSTVGLADVADGQVLQVLPELMDRFQFDPRSVILDL